MWTYFHTRSISSLVFTLRRICWTAHLVCVLVNRALLFFYMKPAAGCGICCKKLSYWLIKNLMGLTVWDEPGFSSRLLYLWFSFYHDDTCYYFQIHTQPSKGSIGITYMYFSYCVTVSLPLSESSETEKWPRIPFRVTGGRHLSYHVSGEKEGGRELTL